LRIELRECLKVSPGIHLLSLVALWDTLRRTSKEKATRAVAQSLFTGSKKFSKNRFLEIYNYINPTHTQNRKEMNYEKMFFYYYADDIAILSSFCMWRGGEASYEVNIT